MPQQLRYFRPRSYGLWRPVVLWQYTNVSGVHGASSGWIWRQYGPLKRWYPTVTLHGVATQKTSTWNITAGRASKLHYFSWAFYTIMKPPHISGSAVTEIQSGWNCCQLHRSTLHSNRCNRTVGLSEGVFGRGTQEDVMFNALPWQQQEQQSHHRSKRNWPFEVNI
jgi:hypothetical protein